MLHDFVAIGWPEVTDISKLLPTDVKSIIKKYHPDYPATKTGQIAGFLKRLLEIKTGDIILIPYYNSGYPIVTVAKVTREYYYDINYYKEHMTHQLGIAPIINISRNELSKRYPNLSNSLSARLTLTKINNETHKEALLYIKKMIKNASENIEYTSNQFEDITNISNLDHKDKQSQQHIEFGF